MDPTLKLSELRPRTIQYKTYEVREEMKHKNNDTIYVRSFQR